MIMEKNIYAKIYLDRDEDGTQVLVFDCAKESVDGIFQKAGRFFSLYAGEDRVLVRNTIYGISRVAISREAREAFRARLSEWGSYEREYEFGEFFISFFSDLFSYMPRDIIDVLTGERKGVPTAEECGTVRRLRADEGYSYDMSDGHPFTDCLDNMTEMDNERLKTLVLPYGEEK